MKGKYKAYNRMYKNGKPIGRTYVVASGSSKSVVLNRARMDNTRWNKKVGAKDGYSAKVVIVKSATPKKRKVSRDPFSSLYGKSKGKSLFGW